MEEHCLGLTLRKWVRKRVSWKREVGERGVLYCWTHLLCFPPYIKPRLEFHNQHFSFPTVGWACTGMSNLYFNLFPKLYWLYLSCCSHRPALIYIYIYIYMGLIPGIYKFRHVIDISTMLASLPRPEIFSLKRLYH